MLRLLVLLGFHGKSHMAKQAMIIQWSHDNGLGA